MNPYTSIPYLEIEAEDSEQNLSRVKALQVGFGSRVLRIDRQGLWMGAEDFASAPFSVDMDGNMTATSLDLSGYLQVGDALSDIGVGNITGTYIASGAITTAKLSATAIDGMTITGALIRTSSGTTRVQLNDATNALEVRKSGTVRVKLDDDDLSFYNSSGALLGYLTTPTTTNFYIGATTGNYLILSVESSSYTINFEVAGTTKGYFSTSGLTLNDDLNLDSNDLLNLRRLNFATSTTNPSADGQMRYYNSGGTEGLRMQFGGSDFQFDATGV